MGCPSEHDFDQWRKSQLFWVNHGEILIFVGGVHLHVHGAALALAVQHLDLDTAFLLENHGSIRLNSIS